MLVARGGRFKVFLDYSGIDPCILKPVRANIIHDGQVVDVENYRHNAVSSSMQRMDGWPG